MYSIKDFFKLKPTSAFEYFIEQESEKVKQGATDVYKFVNKMLKLIQNTVNRIERGKQITKLAESTGVDERDIRDEMDRLTAESVGEVKRSLSKKLHSATSTDELLSVMDTMSYDIRQQSGTKEERVRLSVDESLANFKNLITILDNKQAGLQGWKTGFGLLDSKLSGIPKPIGTDERGEKIPIPGSIMGIAGAPQHGKSTIIQNIAYLIAAQNEDADLKKQFTPIAKALTEKEAVILQELANAQGNTVEMEGYYFGNDDLISKAMRPSTTLNNIINNI